MTPWLLPALVAAVTYGVHQIFTRLAATRIGDGIGGFVLEVSAALSILLYLVYLKATRTWDQQVTGSGVIWSALAGVCVGIGTIAFFLLFKRGGPLSAVPMVLAGGAAIMAAAGILFFGEPATRGRFLGIALSIAGLYLLRK
jgi:transporter family protein